MRQSIFRIAVATAAAALLTTSTVVSAQAAIQLPRGNRSNTTAMVYAGVRVRVVVEGNGRSDLKLYVYDRFGQLVAFDDDCSDECEADWTPLYTGLVTIRVVDAGGFNDYIIRILGGERCYEASRGAQCRPPMIPFPASCAS